MGWTPPAVICAVCAKQFQPLSRRRGGGAIPLYCGDRCRQQAYRGRHPGRKAAQSAAYLASEKGKAYAKRKSELARFGKYGWTETDFLAELDRQNGRCLGCNRAVTKCSGVVDHDHATGAPRGILCQRCNHALGHVFDSPETLHQLAAYLRRDRSLYTVYLSGSLRNPRVPVLAQEIRAYGYDVVDDWYAAGPEADDYWQAYEKSRGHSYAEALRGRAAEHVALFDRGFISVADAVGALLPAGKSTMLELGYAAMLGKTTFLLLDGEEPERYDVMPQIVDIVAQDAADLAAQLKCKEA